MKHLLKRLRQDCTAAFGTVVVAGAGAGGELAELRLLEPTSLLLVEPSPTLAAQLSRQTNPSRNERVVEAAISHSLGRATLSSFNNPRTNSLLAADGLLKAFPNLRPAEEIAISAVTLDSLLTAESFDPTYRHLLILDVNGSEAEILKTASEAILEQFTEVIVVTSERPLYKGGSDEKTVRSLMAKTPFLPVYEDDSAPPPYRCIAFRRDDQRLAVLRVERQAMAQGEELRQLRSELEAARTELCAAKQHAMAQEGKVTAEFGENERLRSEFLGLTKQFKEQQGQHKGALEQLEASHNETAALRTRLMQAQLDLDAERAAHAVKAEELLKSGEQVRSTNAAMGELRSKLQDLQSIHQAVCSELEDAKKAHTSMRDVQAALLLEVDGLRQLAQSRLDDTSAHEAQLRAATEQLAALEARFESLVDERDSALKCCSELTESLSAANARMAALVLEQSRSAEDATHLEAQLRTATEQLATSEVRFKSAIDERDLALKRCSGLTESLSAADARISALILEQSRSAESLSKRSAELEELQRNMRQQGQRLGEMSVRAESAEARLEVQQILSGELKMLVDRLQSAKVELEERRDAQLRDLEHVRLAHQTAEEKMQELLGQLNQSQRYCKEVQDELVGLKDLHHRINSERDQLAVRVKDLLAQTAARDAELERARQDVANLLSSHTSALEARQGMLEQLANLEQEKIDLSSQLKQQIQFAEQLGDQLAALKKARIAQQTALDEAGQQLQVAIDAREALAQAISTLQGDHDALTKRLSDECQQTAALKEKLQSSEKITQENDLALSALKQQLQESQQQRDKHSKRTKELEARLAALEESRLLEVRRSEQAESQLKEFQGKLVEGQKVAEGLKAELSRSQSRRDAIASELELSRKGQQTTAAALEEQRALVGGLEKKLKDLHADHDRVDRKLRESERKLAETEAARLAKEKQAAEQTLQLQEMKQINGELQCRQAALREELVKAEAQIELIKELVLHEPSF